MQENIFWDKKIEESAVKNILKDEFHPRFIEFSALLLSRTNKTKDVFREYLDKIVFCRNWRRIKNRMRKNNWNDSRIIFWDEVYQVILTKIDIKKLKIPQKKQKPLSKKLKQICDIIRKTRKEKSWTQKQLAKKTGLSQQTISFAENGYLNFSFKTFITLLKALDLEINIQSK